MENETPTRRLVTIMFADIVDWSRLVARLDPEDLQEYTDSFFKVLRDEIHKHGGTVENYMGDAVLAVFGAPVAHDDDPLRAMRAALGMQAELRNWNVERAPEDHACIRIGIETGEVFASGTGKDARVAGEAVVVAARLQAAAEPDSILIGERAARAGGRSFELQRLGSRQLKGLPQAVETYSLIGIRADARERGLEAELPLIGREKEMTALRRHASDVRASRRASIVCISGDPGIGKTRLTKESVAPLPIEHVLVGRCLPVGEGRALRPFLEIMASAFGIAESDPREVVGEKLKAASGETETSSDLLEVLAGFFDRTAHEVSDPENERQRLIEVLCAVLTKRSRSADLLVIIIEDLHWADESTLAVLDGLGEKISAPVLFLVTARPDLWGRTDVTLPNFDDVIHLPPLSGDLGKLLLSHILQRDKATEELSSLVLSRAEGNPYFIEETIRTLIDEGLLVRETRWKAKSKALELQLPDSIQGVLSARLDLLPPDERRLLRNAAVIGRIFWKGALEWLLPDDEIGDLLASLVARGFIEPVPASSFQTDEGFRFKHVLMRDVTYGSLPRKQKPLVHRAIGSWIEGEAGDRLDVHSEILSHHYSEAFQISGEEEDRAKARLYSLTAARVSLAYLALSASASFGAKAALLSREPEEIAETCEILGDLATTRSDGDDAWAHYLNSIEALERAGLVGIALSRVCAKLASLATRYAGSLRRELSPLEVQAIIEKGFAHLPPTESKEECLLLLARAALVIFGGVDLGYPGIKDARAALDLAERLGDADLRSASLDVAGGAYLVEGMWLDVAPLTEQRIELVPQLRDQREIADIFGMAAWASAYSGDYASAEDRATQAIQNLPKADVGQYLHSLMWRVYARFYLGDWSGALEDQNEIEALVSESQEGKPVPYTLRAYGAVALIHALQGDSKAASRYRDLLEEIKESRVARGAFEPFLARVLARLGDRRRAADYARDASGGHSGMAAEMATPCAEALCDVAVISGNRDLAKEAIAEGKKEIDRTHLPGLRNFVKRTEGWLLAVEGDLHKGVEGLEHAADGFDGAHAAWEAAFSRLLAAEALAPTDLARASEFARRAYPTLERLGSVGEVERTATLLSAAPVR